MPVFGGLCLSTTGLIKDINSAVTNWASQDGESVFRFSAIIDTVQKKSLWCARWAETSGVQTWGLI